MQKQNINVIIVIEIGKFSSRDSLIHVHNIIRHSHNIKACKIVQQYIFFTSFGQMNHDYIVQFGTYSEVVQKIKVNRIC